MDALQTDDKAMPRVVIRRSFNRPAKPLTPETEALAQTARRVAESLGQKLPFASTGGVCDGNIMQAAGLPTIDTLGVRGGDLHRTTEWIELRSLVERSQLMACLLMELHGVE
jgi:glutamate carboxypeptidase